MCTVPTRLLAICDDAVYHGGMAIVECERCGYRWDASNARKNASLCSSCRARPARTVWSDLGKCEPWRGMFAADEVTPVDDDGVMVMPGLRRCGNEDCVNPSHVEVM